MIQFKGWRQATFRAFLLGAFALIFVSPPTNAAPNDAKQRRDFIMTFFGTDYFENGKKDDGYVEEWELYCHRRHGRNQCELERRRYVGCVRAYHVNSTEDATLEVHELNWRTGKMRFAVHYAEGPFQSASTDQCTLKLDSKILTLVEDLHCVRSKNGTVFERRIPPFEYHYDHPACRVFLIGKDRGNHSRQWAIFQTFSQESDRKKSSQFGKCFDGEQYFDHIEALRPQLPPALAAAVRVENGMLAALSKLERQNLNSYLANWYDKKIRECAAKVGLSDQASQILIDDAINEHCH